MARGTLAPIFLLTDFGLSDPFVGVMKAVALGIAPGAPLVDLTHLIPSQDVRSGAVALEDAFPFLPRPSVVCAVVDPAVGTPRRAIAAQVHGRFLVGPDNGLLAPLIESDPFHAVVLLEASQHIRPQASATFHGRDVFAPAAALLARGEPLHVLGPRLTDLVRLEIPTVEVVAKNRLKLTVLAIDHFGNLAFNLRRSDGLVPAGAELQLKVGEILVTAGMRSTFAEVPEGEPAMYWNSAGRLELAVNKGNAAQRFGRTMAAQLVWSVPGESRASNDTQRLAAS